MDETNAGLDAARAGTEAANLAMVRPSDTATRRLALGLLLTGSTASYEPAIDHFLAYAHEHQLNLEQLFLAYKGTRPVASVLIVPSRGRTAMLFTSPLLERRQVPEIATLTRQALLAQSPRELRLVQALLETTQRSETEALKQAGFKELAFLIYMRRAAEKQPLPLQLPMGVQISHWSEDNRPCFERCILASYEQTLDCPGLVGVRQIDDIIAGHMSTGQFNPTLWYALHQGDEPVAVMLLNSMKQQQTIELVYLGLAPAWRGRGIARELLRHALNIAHDSDCHSITLAVDEINTPAMRLYERMKFRSNARKLAMIFTLNPV